MKKFIYGLVLTASILGVSADEDCPKTLSQEQMTALANSGSVTIKGTTFTTTDQTSIRPALPSGKNILTKATDKSAHLDSQTYGDDTTTPSHCTYKFRSYSQKLSGEDYVKFSISPPQKPSRPSTSLPQQGVRGRLGVSGK